MKIDKIIDAYLDVVLLILMPAIPILVLILIVIFIQTAWRGPCE